MVFNRPQETKKIFEAIRLAKPSKLYISADGARINKSGDQDLCNATRKVVENIDWECEIKTRFSEVNLGCKTAVSNAITWFFDNESEGIILEDDCLPNSSFFRFCDVLLEKYRYDTRIRHISGSTMNLSEQSAAESYYFSKLTNVWGWASWRRVWKDYDVNLQLLGEAMKNSLHENLFNNNAVTRHFFKQFEFTRDGLIDTWDYQYVFCNLINNGLSIIPNRNMISNIGFNANATHTTDFKNSLANLSLESLEEIIHPCIIIPNTAKDIAQTKMQIPSLLDTYIGKVKYAIRSLKR